MSDELNLENLDAVPAEEPVVEASEAAADEAAAPVEPVADLSAESDASVDNADVESDAPAATESAPVASTQTETVSLDEDEEEVNESEQAEETDAGQQAVDEFSKSLRSLDGKWYVLHTYSGYENAVKAAIEKSVVNRGMSDMVLKMEIPMETVTEVTESGVMKEVERKVFPGYVLIKMILTDDTWHLIRNIRGVTGFVGEANKAIPLTEDEVAALGVEKHEIVVLYNVGDTVKITDGPFTSFTGTVEEIDPEKNKVRVAVFMFGRETPIELELDQVEVLH